MHGAARRTLSGLAALLLIGGTLPSLVPATLASSTLVFADGFENGYAGWVRVAASGGSAYTTAGAALTGAKGLRLAETSAAGSVAYVRRRLPDPSRDVTISVQERVRRSGPIGGWVPLLRLFDSAGTRILSIFRANGARGTLYVSYARAAHATTGVLPLGAVGALRVRIRIGGASGIVSVALGARTIFSTARADVGTRLIGSIQLGNETPGQPFVLDADTVRVTSPAVGSGASACGSLQARIDATPPGGLLELTGCTFSAGARIARPLTLRGATIEPGPGTPGLLVTAGGVTLEGLRVLGAQAAAYDGREVGILVRGTAGAPLAALTIRSSEVGRFGGDGIRLDHVSGFALERLSVHDVVYAGVIVLSGSGGRIADSSVRRVGVLGAGANEGNAYGITLTSVAGEPPSADIVVEGDTVTDVPTWHALDTHGGQRIVFRANTVARASRALFITGETGGATRATAVSATGNLFGAPAPVTFNLLAVTTYATVGVTISGNTLEGWPADRRFQDYRGLSTGLVVGPNTCDGAPC